MDQVKKTIEHLKPQEVPMLEVDQPLYNITKKMQRTFPKIFREDKFVVMLGGFHIKIALRTTMGDMLHASGWPEALTEAVLTKIEAAATSFL